jgi:hypothetical protein
MRQRTLPTWELAIEGAWGEGMIGVAAGLGGGGGVRRRVRWLSELGAGVLCGFDHAAGRCGRLRLGFAFAHSGEDGQIPRATQAG